MTVMNNRGSSKLVMPMLALNAVALIGMLGLFVYTRVLYKRPVITEAQQRKILDAELERKEKARIAAFVPALYKVPKFEANLKPSGNKEHMLSIGLSLEMADQSFQSLLDDKRPQFMNRLNQVIANTTAEEIITIQGRLLFRSKIFGIISEILKVEKGPAPVRDLYFTEFLIQ